MTPMATRLHDPGVHAALRRRVQSLTPASRRQWGKMSVGQMLFHVNLVLAESLGEYTAAPSVRGLPKVLVRWMVISVPWPKGAPTRPDMLVTDEHDFEHEKARCLEMLDRFAAKSMDVAWPAGANFPMTGRHWSRLQFKHLDHHLKQFGA
jgi:hypothetical protein